MLFNAVWWASHTRQHHSGVWKTPSSDAAVGWCSIYKKNVPSKLVYSVGLKVTGQSTACSWNTSSSDKPLSANTKLQREVRQSSSGTGIHMRGRHGFGRLYRHTKYWSIRAWRALFSATLWWKKSIHFRFKMADSTPRPSDGSSQSKYRPGKKFNHLSWLILVQAQ